MNFDPAGATYELLRRHLERWLEWRGCSDPAGAASEAIARAYSQRDRLEHMTDSDFRAFVFGIARNVAQEWRRSSAREQPLLPGSEWRYPSPVDEEKRALDRLLISRVQRCLTRVEWDLLYRYATCDRVDLGREFDVTPETLRVRIHRIRRKIEKCLGKGSR